MAAPNQTQTQKKPYERERSEEMLVRISGNDIAGSRNLLTGLTKIKGVSWAISNALCKKLKLDKTRKISELSKEEIKNIEEFLKNPDIANFLKNRRNDPETGETSHNTSNTLDVKHDFDIRRMKKIRSYKGVRHTARLPVRGQRTRSHFRKKGQAVRVRKRK